MSFYDRRRGLLPAEDLHDVGRCAYCGIRGEYPELVRTVIVSTHAPGRVCADRVSCLRRQRNAA